MYDKELSKSTATVDAVIQAVVKLRLRGGELRTKQL